MAQYRMKRLGELPSQGSALASPMDSEAQALQEKQAQIKAVNDANVVPAAIPVEAPTQVSGQLINAHAQYGDRPQEKRIDVNSMLTPLGSARAKGGPVEADEPYVVGEEGPEVIVPEENGEVIPNEGAPVDFGGPVNPDIPKASAGMDTSNPAPAQVIPGQPQEGVKGELSNSTLSGKPSPYGTATGAPSMKPLGGAHEAIAQQKAAQSVDVARQRDLIEQDKKVAAAKGPDGIMDLGIASIHEDVLNKTHPPEGVGLGEEKAVGPAPDAEGLPTSSNTNPGLGSAALPAPAPSPAVDQHAELEQKRNALKATMEGPDTEAAGKAMRQLAELNKNNPYGSAGNHPGIGGKILHGLAKAGNIAGNIAAPGTMQLIPGTDLNMERQKQQGLAEEAQGAEVNKDNAVAAKAKMPVPVKPQDQLAQNRLDAQNRLKELTVALQNPNIAPADKAKAEQEQEQIYATDKELRPALNNQADKPVGDQGAQQHDAELGTLTNGMPPEEAQKFHNAYKIDPKDSLSKQQKMLDDAKATAALSAGERDRALSRDAAAQARETAVNARKDAKVAAGDAKDLARSDKSFQYNNGELDKLSKPIEDTALRMTKLQDTVNQRTPQADALIAPELLTVMAGGMGSGLRMNEAEISRIVGGRNIWQGIEATLNKVRLDPKNALSIPDAQREQIQKLIQVVRNRMDKKQQILEDTRQALLASDRPEDHRKALADAHKSLTAVDHLGDEKKKEDTNAVPKDIPAEHTHIYRDPKTHAVVGYALNNVYHAYTPKTGE